MQSKKMVSVEFPADLAKKSRVVAANLNLSRSELIRRATENFIAQIEREQNKPATRKVRHG